MKQKLFTFFLALAASAGTIFAEKVQIGDFYYNLDYSDRTAEVTSEAEDCESDPNYQYLTEANIPDVISWGVDFKVTGIGDYAFCNCGKLTSVTIPEGVTTIGHYAFCDCGSLKCIELPSTITHIKDCAFYHFKSENTIVYVISKAVVPPTIIPFDEDHNNRKTPFHPLITRHPLVVPAESMEAYKAAECWSSFQNIRPFNEEHCVVDGGNCGTEGDNLTWEISRDFELTFYGSGAMKDNDNSIPWGEYKKYITSIVLPDEVTRIGNDAFFSCSLLTSINLPSQLTSIGNSAFLLCNRLKSIALPSNLSVIGENAFAECSVLTSITIPESITSIDGHAFANCTGLTEITLPNSVTSIEESTFNACTGLTSVTIGNSVTSVGALAFNGCTALKSITCKAATPPTCASNAFNRVSVSYIPLYVPAGSEEAYKAADQWKRFKIQPIQQAEEAEVTKLEAKATENSVVIEWPKVDEATVYTIEIKKNGELICTLTFNELGQLQNIAFAAPSRNGNRGSAQPRMALQTANGWKYTITGLEANTTYSYSIVAKKSDDSVAYEKSISFTTKNTTTDLESIQPSADSNQKVIRNGQVLIIRDGKTYTIQGAEVR